MIALVVSNLARFSGRLMRPCGWRRGGSCSPARGASPPQCAPAGGVPGLFIWGAFQDWPERQLFSALSLACRRQVFRQCAGVSRSPRPCCCWRVRWTHKLLVGALPREQRLWGRPQRWTARAHVGITRRPGAAPPPPIPAWACGQQTDYYAKVTTECAQPECNAAQRNLGGDILVLVRVTAIWQISRPPGARAVPAGAACGASAARATAAWLVCVTSEPFRASPVAAPCAVW